MEGRDCGEGEGRESVGLDTTGGRVSVSWRRQETMVPSRLLDLGFEIMAGTYIGLELSGGELRVVLFIYSFENMYWRTYCVPGTMLTSQGMYQFPAPPHPPGHPAQHVPDQVTHQLTKSPGIDRTKCSGVLGSPHSSP